MCKVDDLYSDDSQLKPWAYIREEFNLEPGHFLHWFSIVQCIPKNWKNVLNTPVPDVQSSLRNTAAHPFQNLRPNSVYRKIISNIFQAPSAQKTVLKIVLCSNIEWNRAHVLPRLCTIDSYLRVFQYKILNNILFLNNRLFKMGKVDSSLCSFCKVTSETITHIFCGCNKSKFLWQKIQNWCKPVLSLPDLSPEIVIFGLFDAREYILLQNFILLLYKKFIYEKRSDPSRLHFLSFTCCIDQIYKIEYRIAMKRGKLDFHFQKWGDFEKLLDGT